MSSEKQNIEKIIMEIVEKQMSVSRGRITHETAFINDLEADSLDLAELHNQGCQKVYNFRRGGEDKGLS